MQRLFDQMKAEAMPLGSQLIEQEADLDRQFANRTVTPESLKDIHRGGRGNPGRIAGNPPEISPLDRRHPQPVANDSDMQNCAAMAAVIGATTSRLPPPGGLYPARQTDIVRN